MKRNVDLTTDFDFQENSIRDVRLSTPKIAHIKRRLFNNVVDIPYCIQNDIEHNQRGEIIQGDRSRREFLKMVSYDIHCECCGRTLNYPWESFDGFLCPHCNNVLEKDFTQIPWNRA